MKMLRNALVRILYPYWERRLTVLMYHRVTSVEGHDFVGYEPTVSATAQAFDRQMGFVRRHFNAVSLDQLHAWLQGGASLPRRPLLITFDDGYRDNFDAAWPVLERYGLPAVIFLATDYVGGERPFDWDLAAYCFRNTRKRQAQLPLLGMCAWRDDAEREAVMNRWIRLMLSQARDARREAAERLPEALGVPIRPEIFRRLCLSWEQVREMCASRVAIGSHGCSHVVLDRVSQQEVAAELIESRVRIAAECGGPVPAFAYPNGVVTAGLEGLVKDAGYRLAFGTEAGPVGLATVAERPLAISRISISRHDGMLRFQAKLAGLSRLRRQIRRRTAVRGGESGV